MIERISNEPRENRKHLRNRKINEKKKPHQQKFGDPGRSGKKNLENQPSGFGSYSSSKSGGVDPLSRAHLHIRILVLVDSKIEVYSVCEYGVPYKKCQ